MQFGDNNQAALPSPFAQASEGARPFESGMLAKVQKHDYVIGYEPAVGVYRPSEMLQLEGDFLIVDPSVSIGPVILSFEAADSAPQRQPITLLPGDRFEGKFKGVSSSSPSGACGRLLYGYGWKFVEGSQRGQRFQSNGIYSDAFAAQGSYSNSGTGTGFTFRPTTTHFGIGGGAFRGIGVRNGIANFCGTIPLANAPTPPTVYARFNSGSANTLFNWCRLLAFATTVEAAQRCVSATFEIPPIADGVTNTAGYLIDLEMSAPWSGVLTSTSWQVGCDVITYK